MSQSKRKATRARLADETVDSETTGSRKWGRQTFAMIGAGIAVILLTVGILHYQLNIAPFRRVIITVDNNDIRMDYFLKRTKLAGSSPTAMLEILTREQIIKSEAPRYGIRVNEEEIDRELRSIAESDNITESEFGQWYRQQLNETGLTNAEYRELIGTRLQAARLHDYLAQKVSTVAEQVHIYGILVKRNEEALKIKERLEAGEDFASLAQEVSLDEESKEKGGDLGWFPRGVMGLGFDYVVFSLGIGDISEPVPTGEGFYLLKVSEKAMAREIDENSVKALRSRALENWLLGEMPYHDIEYNFDPEINAWLNYQLAKMARD